MVSKAWLNFKGAHLEFIEGSGLNFSKMLANFYQGQAANTVNHHKKLENTQYIS